MGIEQLNELAVSWGRFIGAQVVDSTIVLLLVAGIWFAVRRRVPAQFGYCLFLLVLLKAIVPGQMAVPIPSIATSVVSPSVVQMPVSVASTQIMPNTVAAERAGNSELRIVGPVRSEDTNVLSVPVQASVPAPVPASVSNTVPRSVRFVLTAFFPPITLLMFAWGAFATFFLGRLVYTEWHTRRLIKRSTPVDPDTLPISLDWLMRTARVQRRFRVCESEWAASPLVSGLFSPVLVLPKGFFIHYADNEVCWILLHELAHLRRWDTSIKLFQKLIQSVFFFHPAVWIANWTVDRQREFACDDDAVSRSNLSRLDCGEGFLNAVLQANNVRTHVSDPIGLFNSKLLVKERLMRILGHNDGFRPGLTLGMTAVLFVLAVCVIPFTGCGPSKSAQVAEKRGMTQPPASEVLDYTFVAPPRGADHSDGVICHVLPVLERLDEVRVVKWRGPYGEEHSQSLTGGEGYSLIDGGRSIKITAPMPEWHSKFVLIGKWKVPWRFRALKEIEPGSTQMLLGDHICQEGVDFKIDETKRVIRVLKEELCDPSKPVLVNYRLKGEVINPQTLHSMYRGDRDMYAEPIAYTGDESVFKRFLGIPQDRPSSSHDFANADVTGAVPTDDPRVYALLSLVQRKSMLVSFPNLSKKAGGRFVWLTEGVDYRYDENEALLTLISDKAAGKPYLYVQGKTIPGVFLFRRPLTKPSTVTLDGKPLEEGVNFTVDYETGKVTVVDPAIEKPDAEFHFVAGNFNVTRGKYRIPKSGNWGPAATEDYDPNIDRSGMHIINALPTIDPKVYSLYQPHHAKGLLLYIQNVKRQTLARWLERGRDYTYDEETGSIAFLGEELPFDPENAEWVFVNAAPRQDLFLFHKPLEKGSVSVTLNGKELREGGGLFLKGSVSVKFNGKELLRNEGFAVDYETGAVRVLDPRINARDATYVVTGPGQEFVDRETQNSRQAERKGKPNRSAARAEDIDPEVDPRTLNYSSVRPTGDPMVFVTYRPMQTKGLVLGINNMVQTQDVKWLKRGRDYTYDEEDGVIAFAGEKLPFDEPRGDFVFVLGVPKR